MADNTTTYTAVIETEVKGTDEVEQLGDAAEGADGKFKSLKSQIRETTIKLQELADKGQEGTKEFKKLSDQLDELGDQQKKVAFQSGQIEDKLAALPGPIGAIGKGFQSAKSAVDTFGVRLAIATGGITLIIGAIIAMKDALGKSAEGQATLSKVTDAFSKLLAPLLTMVSAVAIPTFEFFANVINKVADAAEWVAVKLGFTKKSIDGFNESANEANKKFFEQAEKDMEEAKRVADVYKAIDEKKKREALARQKAYQEKSDKLKEEQKKKDEEKKDNSDRCI
jgi:septal ring factor EnvC (AmiA/AmiB activator)